MGGDCMTMGPKPTVCRLCMGDVPTIPIFPDCGQNVAEKINAVFPFKVTPDDPYPKNICQVCLNKLNFTYEFMMAINSRQPERIRALHVHFNNF